jgi:hypothetical protein
MNVRNHRVVCGVALWLVTAVSSLAFAQGPRGGGANIPEALPPPQNFETSIEHYEYLKRLYNGGTVHTIATVPQWTGLWSSGGNNGQGLLFLTQNVRDRTGEIIRAEPGAPVFRAEVLEGVLTPEYEAAFRMRRELGSPYDRLTTCEPAGMPRWLVEPYVREFVNTPTQSWWLNDLANDTRRIHINQDHQNIDGSHSAQGDSVGFWVDDMLIVHTVDVYPNDYFRGLPPTSNQFESVEVWRMETRPNGDVRLLNNVTFYDSLALLDPLTATYTYRPRTDLEAAGFRIRHWECDSNQNTFLVFDDDGSPRTQFRLPGEEGFDDVRGADPNRNPDLPPDLSGQSKNPIFNDRVQ